MQAMHRLRSYHAILAFLVVLTYATGDDNVLHAWLGYAVAAVILMRLTWALTGVPHLGLMRFYPYFKGLQLSTAMTHPAISRTLLLCIAACLITVMLSGIAMDQGYSIGIADQTNGSSVLAENGLYERNDHDEDEHNDESIMSEAHEILANCLMILIATHVSYLFLFKRPLALFMLFFHTPPKKDGAQ